jgi:hypothetical protein
MNSAQIFINAHLLYIYKVNMYHHRKQFCHRSGIVSIFRGHPVSFLSRIVPERLLGRVYFHGHQPNSKSSDYIRRFRVIPMEFRGGKNYL